MPESLSNPPPSTILIVDDEPVVLTALQQTLERERFHVVACSSPTKALSILQERDFAVIISDQKMPEMLGLDFLIESRRIRPHASRILITAVLSLPTIVDAINKGEIFRFVAKPWLREELIATVRNAVHRHELVTHNAILQAETQSLNAQLTQANAALARQVEDLEQQRQRLDAANRELSASYEHSLELCRRILTTYDPILGGQAKTLVELAGHMAGSDLLDEAQRHALRTAAWLCDMGLIGVPREMLRAFRSNPDDLSERERAMLHNHPVYSQTLAALVDDSNGVGEVIRAHHERFDGRGYPDGLAGDAIPWPARCLAVALGYVESGLPKSAAIDLQSWIMPALAVMYAALSRKAWIAPTEEVWIIDPPPRCCIKGMAYLLHRNGPVSVTPRQRFHSSSVVSTAFLPTVQNAHVIMASSPP